MFKLGCWLKLEQAGFPWRTTPHRCFGRRATVRRWFPRARPLKLAHSSNGPVAIRTIPLRRMKHYGERILSGRLNERLCRCEYSPTKHPTIRPFSPSRIAGMLMLHLDIRVAIAVDPATGPMRAKLVALLCRIDPSAALKTFNFRLLSLPRLISLRPGLQTGSWSGWLTVAVLAMGSTLLRSAGNNNPVQ